MNSDHYTVHPSAGHLPAGQEIEVSPYVCKTRSLLI